MRARVGVGVRAANLDEAEVGLGLSEGGAPLGDHGREGAGIPGGK